MDLTYSQVIIHDKGTYPLYRDERLHLLDFLQADGKSLPLYPSQKPFEMLSKKT